MSSNNIFMKRFGKNFGSKISNDINVTLSKIQLSWEKKCFSHFNIIFIKYKKKYQQCHGVICFDININNNKTKWKKKNNIIHIHNNKWYYNTTKYLTQYSEVGTYSCIKPHNFFLSFTQVVSSAKYRSILSDNLFIVASTNRTKNSAKILSEALDSTLKTYTNTTFYTFMAIKSEIRMRQARIWLENTNVASVCHESTRSLISNRNTRSQKIYIYL